ncbi:MAG: hypothetical protein ACYTCU_09890 [Planctomycetota bacterium]|jgi:uncharacterized lipoprotein
MRVPKLLLPLLLVASGLGCATDEAHQWAESRFVGLSYEALFGVVASTIDGEGFAVRRHDTTTGEIETDWAYGTSLREVRGPSRRKVHARVEIDDATGGFRVRLRVAEEVLRQRGELATHVRDSTDWERYSDNWDDATYLMAKLTALLRDYRVTAEIMPEPLRAGERDLRP